MSIFAYPSKMMPDVKTMEEMGDEMMAMLPRQLGPAVNLAAYPAGAAAAMSALGLAAIGQAVGLMLGTVAGAVDAGWRVNAAMGLAEPAQFEWPSPFAFWHEREDVPPVAERGFPIEPEASPVIAEKAKASKAPTAEAVEPAGRLFAIMPEDFRAPPAIERPDLPDDLKMISGIGPKLEQVLNEKGIWTFAQIAAWVAPEIAWIDDCLSLRGRIERDDWLTQAAALARGGREEYVKVFGKEPK